ncbi:OLC1v1010981C1 [Oldenlandia corymbosa var. corymbosa]|uniref:OLC1v1010981C1 n=1 Tax=Oldenlandia corymbosa var. corymbosa TaxID=529605 RepID=A0AAV1DST8_OLDCO|nr:OLC1v1010981C1 [Oldenlandia corymbosa var. corymbosa]
MDGGDSRAAPNVPRVENLETAAATNVMSQTFDQIVKTLGLDDQCLSGPEKDDSQLDGGLHPVGAGVTDVPARIVEAPAVSGQAVRVNTVMVGHVGQLNGKRKRGRPPRGTAPAPKPQPPKPTYEDEDVCFICFDGGSLVLCDRKGCPKAYHPACIKRDEAFFRSKAKWNCGWHICSVCQKASHYMCYTCTYSLCKGCTKGADYVCVRGNKGFCTTCMKTIMLIEKKDTGQEKVQVDFDDKLSWEYLFKVYWTCLKDSLSLTVDELMQAKNPWRAQMMDYKQRPPLINHSLNGSMVSVSVRSSENLELNMPKEQHRQSSSDHSSVYGIVAPICVTVSENSELNMPSKQQSPGHNYSVNENMVSTSVGPSETSELNVYKEQHVQQVPGSNNSAIEKLSSDNSEKLAESKDWASKELLEFVSHMKNGDTSALSPFDVQSLILEYIKRNNLRDPRRKSQIICDIRLKNLFGKPRVGHIEMLKLLEYHILIKEEGQNNGFIPAGIVGSVADKVGADQNSNLLIDQNKKRRTRKKAEERAPQTNLDDLAAIDVHNISLIYLRRNLVESLVGGDENFRDKVVGSIVRIRVSSNDQGQDIYRLVQVVGTTKAAEPYKLGDKTTDYMLEVLNLNKKETLQIDAISDQDFSPEECRRLRQSIRYKLVKLFTVGEIQTKAIALQAVKLDDMLAAEILRFNHLRDRANEKGQYVEKLQLLKTPEERQRRLTEIPEVHADPKMNPDCESEEDDVGGKDKNQNEVSRAKRPKFHNNRSRPITSKRKVEEGTKKAHNPNENWNTKHEIQVTVNGPESEWSNKAIGKASNASVSSGGLSAIGISEMDKMWHYRDPNGKVQGPFAMMQLRKWSTTGYFPADMKIWSIDELNESMLLTDALDGQFCKAPSLEKVPCLQDTSRPPSSKHSFNLEQAVEQQVSGYETKELKSALDHSSHNSCAPTMHHITSGDSLESSNGPIDARQSSGQNLRPFLLNLDLNQKDSNSGLAAIATPPNDTADGAADMLDLPSPTPRTFHEILAGQSIQKKETKLDVPVQGSVRSGLPTPIRKLMDEALSSPASGEKQENLLSTTTKPMEVVLPCTSPKPTDDYQGEQPVENNQSVLNKVSVPDAGPSWSASLGIGGSQLHEVAHQWPGYPPAASKPSDEGWGSGLVSMASVKPTEILDDQVGIPNLNINPLVHSSTSHPPSHISSWQAGVHEPIEFSTLAEESVSDLLAEVDAMESQSGLASPTSGMKLNDELIDNCRNDCFSSIEELSPTPDAGKSDAVSSGEVQFPSQSPVVDDPGVDSQADVFDPLRRPDGNSATSSERETRSTNVPPNPRESGANIHPPEGCTTSQSMTPTPMTRGRNLEPLDTGWPGLQANMNMGWAGSPQGFPNMGWGAAMGGPWVNPNFNLGAYGAGIGWDSPRSRYGAERFSSPRDWGYQGGESGYGRGRPMWGRQPHGGGGGGGGSSSGGGYSRPPPKGQRVCKFYESGHCKKGALCDYLHP